MKTATLKLVGGTLDFESNPRYALLECEDGTCLHVLKSALTDGGVRVDEFLVERFENRVPWFCARVLKGSTVTVDGSNVVGGELLVKQFTPFPPGK